MNASLDLIVLISAACVYKSGHSITQNSLEFTNKLVDEHALQSADHSGEPTAYDATTFGALVFSMHLCMTIIRTL